MVYILYRLLKENKLMKNINEAKIKHDLYPKAYTKNYHDTITFNIIYYILYYCNASADWYDVEYEGQKFVKIMQNYAKKNHVTVEHKFENPKKSKFSELIHGKELPVAERCSAKCAHELLKYLKDYMMSDNGYSIGAVLKIEENDKVLSGNQFKYAFSTFLCWLEEAFFAEDLRAGIIEQNGPMKRYITSKVTKDNYGKYIYQIFDKTFNDRNCKLTRKVKYDYDSSQIYEPELIKRQEDVKRRQKIRQQLDTYDDNY